MLETKHVLKESTMKKTKGKLPPFKNLQEMADFWDTHEFTDFAHEFSPVKNATIAFDKKTYLPITLAMYEKLEKIASARDLSVDALIKQWVEEKLAEF